MLQHLKEHHIQGALTADDVMFYYTTCGWMMWNWLVGALAVGATLVLYDGSPFAPSGDVLWQMAEDEGVSVFGTSAKYLQTLEAKGFKPRAAHDLSKLRQILSTGSTLLPETFDYVYRDIKADVDLGSITGGTDILGCFAGQNVTTPVFRGEIQGLNLGMAVQAWDDAGRPVTDVRGDLVCVKPFPSMPVAFWGDADGARYRRAYFEKFAGQHIWAHGDYCIVNSKTGGVFMLGRSDATLNPGGVRFGSAEVYTVVESMVEIEDSLCVGQKVGDDERVLLFLQMAPGHAYDPAATVAAVKKLIRAKLTPRHVPAVVLETKDIPYTLSGKKVEVAVKQVIHGESVKNRSALRNPESLDLYKGLKELVLE